MTTQNTTAKIFALAVVTAIALIIFGLCFALLLGVEPGNVNAEEYDTQYLVFITELNENQFGEYTEKAYDPETLVMYEIERDDNGLTISALHNPDGTPKLYKPEK